MDIWQSLNGMVKLEYVSADNACALSNLQERGITFENVRFIDELTVHFCVRRQYVRYITKFAQKRADQCKVLTREGLYWSLRGIVKRPVLLVGFSVILLLTILIPTRILFYRIEGNTTVPDNKILELVSQNGIPFAATRRQIRSEKVKNALLEAIPELEWVGINTAGCVATISVRERQNAEAPSVKKGISSIIAIRDGVIRELTVISGSPMVKTGQAVKEGQVLISGYTDCKIAVRAERAIGEVYATTNRELTVLTPLESVQRSTAEIESSKYAVIFGKNRINFYKDSGNSDTGCVKIYEENYLTLPGGFQLPVAIVTEKTISYETIPVTVTSEESRRILLQYARSYLQDQMVAGRILSGLDRISQSNGVVCLDGEYACLEIIGKEQNEEIIKP